YARLSRLGRDADPALRVPRERERVRPDLRAHSRAGARLLGGPHARAALRDQSQRRRTWRLLERPERPLPRDHHTAVRERLRGGIASPGTIVANECRVKEAANSRK